MPIPPDLSVLGWREWVSLPELGVPWLRAKVDTGAKTSSLHAEDCEEYGEDRVRFRIVTRRGSYECDCVVHDRRQVRSSSGHAEVRPVILADLVVLGKRQPIELTLTDRASMKFPMLIGRRALEGRYAVDPSKSYVGGVPPRKKRREDR